MPLRVLHKSLSLHVFPEDHAVTYMSSYLFRSMVVSLVSSNTCLLKPQANCRHIGYYAHRLQKESPRGAAAVGLTSAAL